MSETHTHTTAERDGSSTAEARDDIVAAERAKEEERAARLFDVRWVIGGLFTLYGVMLLVASAFASDADIDKAQGLNVNFWTGLGMLILGLVFLAWVKSRPMELEPAHRTDDEEAEEAARDRTAAAH